MKKGRGKRIVLTVSAVFALLLLVLGVHIFIMMRPKAPDATTRVMARIDIKQPISQEGADSITAWLYQQKGVDRVMINPSREIVLFTFFPIKTTGDRIVGDFKSDLSYKADRFVPTAAQIGAGCPYMAANSVTYKVYNFFKHHF